MALATGARVGPCEITHLLGEGGMGEVYRARDTKLNREVVGSGLISRGVVIGRGDVVLVRTGRWVRQTQAGPHPTMARWLHQRGVALVGDDGSNDVAPSLVPGVSHAFHQLALVAMGMPLLDNLDLDALARQCADARRWTFFFVGAPLPIEHGTGSPLNPLAVF